jgi:hypothetical protein
MFTVMMFTVMMFTMMMFTKMLTVMHQWKCSNWRLQCRAAAIYLGHSAISAELHDASWSGRWDHAWACRFVVKCLQGCVITC